MNHLSRHSKPDPNDLRHAGRAPIVAAMLAARQQTIGLLEHLTPEQWQVPYLRTINPPLWELGHVGWFQEYWCHRWLGLDEPRASMLIDADAFFDSRVVDHRSRWQMAMPALADVKTYLADVLDQTLDQVERTEETPEQQYFHRLTLFHEHMHIEAMAYTWQTLAVPLGQAAGLASTMPNNPRALAKDLAVAAGTWTLGSGKDEAFIFDNEKWAHEQLVAAFAIASQPVSNAQFLEFVADAGYQHAAFWEADYFAALTASGRHMPHYWRQQDGVWQRRRFDRWEAIPANEPVVHVSAFEAQAYCRWAKRRLPSEIEWEMAAHQRKGFSWGDQVWEWTSSVFQPFPGFSPDPYSDYSQPAFGNTRVVRGGSYLTPRPLLHLKFRNYFEPQRHDMFVGFRTCAL